MLEDGTPVIALIPARGGSKGIIRKNLTPFHGAPLINCTINAALNSVVIDEVWVSSEDSEILDVSSSLGANILRRPDVLATDQATAVEVVNHFIQTLPVSTLRLDPMIVYLQPTSPLRNGVHIYDALKQMHFAGFSGVVSVVKAELSPYKAFKLDSSGMLESIFEEHLSNIGRQNLPDCYYPNGAIYGFRINSFIARGGFPTNGSFPFIMSTEDSVDIDDMQDLRRAIELFTKGK
jgi:CMP-N-acetylneuraminic acid synthetase